MPEVVKFIGYKWVFIGKCNEKNEIMRLGIDYEETYSFMMNTNIFRYLICLVVLKGLDMHLMDVITTNLYGSLYIYIYIYENP